MLNPHTVLGVTATADVKEVKRAYRKLALQYHPDVCKSADGHERFMALTQAYEQLLGRAEGKTDPGHASATSWDFHDWYWNFRMQRSWEKQARKAKKAAEAAKKAAAEGAAAEAAADEEEAEAEAAGEEAPGVGGEDSAESACGGGRRSSTAGAGFKQTEGRENLRSQLAGLRHRAAVRANRPPAPPSPTASSASASAASPAASTASADGPEQPRRRRAATSLAAATAATGSAASVDQDQEPGGEEAPAAQRPQGQGQWFGGLPRPDWTWSWTWSWEETGSDDEGAPPAPAHTAHAPAHAAHVGTGSAASAASADGGEGDDGGLASQFTHVLYGMDHVEAAPAGHVGGGSREDGGCMTVHDGHLGTVLNSAVPFPASYSANTIASGSAAADAEQAGSDASGAEEAGAEDAEPESPFSNPWEKAAAGGAQAGAAGARRRQFVADSGTREGVAHQLSGLRRKAAMKVAMEA
ncbi:hypothetical protein HYH03_009149 [Edaphochlamys debaryana]|uniref:J domain-containing protein n=1 Tax=Edaphochlamys debaryana TaxID=47281 RepID=A0A835Y7M3_9CHLO|nr:hypothetical protein HYH03_009149 [Edaphochlamys debaryana]|eukprot:KAG2492484.1 hypothetical protein HYH03_009149 [Edaphochlamys debaryana]